jgi:hypothetical protein
MLSICVCVGSAHVCVRLCVCARACDSATWRDGDWAIFLTRWTSTQSKQSSIVEGHFDTEPVTGPASFDALYFGILSATHALALTHALIVTHSRSLSLTHSLARSLDHSQTTDCHSLTHTRSHSLTHSNALCLLASTFLLLYVSITICYYYYMLLLLYVMFSDDDAWVIAVSFARYTQ